MLLEKGTAIIGAAPLCEQTRTIYARNFRRFVDDTGIAHEHEMSNKAIRSYLQELNGKLSGSTVRQVESALRLVMQELSKPVLKERCVKFGTVPPHFTMAQLNKALPLLEGPTLMAFLLASTMGFSASDLETVERSAFTIDLTTVSLKDRTVEVSPLIKDYLRCYLQYLEFFFPAQTLLISTSHSVISRNLREAGIKAGLDGLNLQRLRNSYIIHMLQTGSRPADVAAAVGIQLVPYAHLV